MNLRLGGHLGYRLLSALCRRPEAVLRPDDALPGPQGAAKLKRLLGREASDLFVGRHVLDFGCGEGAEAVAVAQRGVQHVWGIDIQEQRLEAARQRALAAGVADRCVFLNAVTQHHEVAELAGTIDCAYSIDAFEHCARADLILEQLHGLLAPGGQLLISFGPPWRNPYGSHLRYLCRWPWIHLLFREETILAVRAEYRNDGAKRFEDVEGGLNRMTLARFLRLVDESPFQLDMFRPVPLSTRFIEGPRFWNALLANPLTREYLTSVVLCRLTKPLVSQVNLEVRELELAVH
jgi:SAM-dependent methyltransferase